ncbi:MAG: aldolase [Methanotrichaceae archaeon]|nr:aldolase [Methanotrichaceae archaeon]
MDGWMQIAEVGRRIVRSGLASSRFGNMSIRFADSMLITRTGSLLDEIDPSQVIEVDLEAASARDALASSEAIVHRAVYSETSARAIVHTHSPYAVALSILEDRLDPLDGEGRAFLGQVPVVEGAFGTAKLARNVARALSQARATIARGHGVFAAGGSLAEAYSMACMVEHSAQVICIIGWRAKVQG